MAKAIKILLVEDDVNLADNIVGFLQDFADVKTVTDGLDGEFEAQEVPYDLIISDLMLPGESGLELIKNIRENHIETPVLILTAKTSLDDKIEGFNVGADDYLTKPFHREELLVRVKALLRRSGVYSEDNTITIGDVLINLENRGVQVHGQPVKLVGKEFDILTYLGQNKNIIVTRDQIFDRVWGIDSDTTINVVNIYLNNLRRKLEAVGQNDLIKTLRNIGFILEVPDAKDSESKSAD
ncbi:response regulator transcription factor [Leuconostocaceae bacterium ESL0723]|nr:response regulator transcription factor [Lactobacillaceae bacterium L1_55_11]WEV54285.1 response regulator transcription factor [Leuconostocaceae bacterium ESL0723]